MLEPRHLENAPIKEAVFDIRVRLPEGDHLEALKGIHDKIRNQFPGMRLIHEVSIGMKGNFESEKPDETLSDHRLKGYRFETQDRRQLVQCRLDGFTFNQLRPYPSWEAMRDQASPAWDLYRHTVNPEEITRLALRYINVLTVPLGVPFEEYLASPPSVPDGLPQSVAAFISRVTLVEAETGCLANVTHSFDGVPDPSEGGLVTLDIDAYETIKDSSNLDVMREFEKLHEFKNRIFFSSITEKALRQYT